jgi:hypothetical protein
MAAKELLIHTGGLVQDNMLPQYSSLARRDSLLKTCSARIYCWLDGRRTALFIVRWSRPADLAQRKLKAAHRCLSGPREAEKLMFACDRARSTKTGGPFLHGRHDCAALTQTRHSVIRNNSTGHAIVGRAEKSLICMSGLDVLRLYPPNSDVAGSG